MVLSENGAWPRIFANLNGMMIKTCGLIFSGLSPRFSEKSIL